MPKNPIKDRVISPNQGVAFITFNPTSDEGRRIATEASKNLTESYQGVSRTQARTQYQSFEPNISVRDNFSRGDYEYFRPKEAVPKKQKDIISFCMEAYRRVGIVHNIIDLMADFAVQGVRFSHPNKSKQKLLRAWGKKIKQKVVSERFANLLLRSGTAAVRRSMAKLPAAEEDRMLAQGDKLAADGPMPEQIVPERRTIPIRYTFLNPLTLEILGDELAQFTGKQIIALKINSKLKQQITNPKGPEKDLIALLPAFLVNAVKQGRNVIPLEQDKLFLASYKKDDWQAWADPMTYCILDDLISLEKMKLADLAALDGAISQVRLWTLGDLEKGILPTDAAIDKLANILLSNPGGGAFDLIWGPELKVQEYKTDVHHFLGGDKYEPVLQAIYGGLGVPQTLTGATSGNSGKTNNVTSLQTMIHRLEYVRDRLVEFWDNELEIFRLAMGWQEAGKVVFTKMTMTDEAAEKALLIQLWDRHLVSDEVILERFKEHPDLEIMRIRRETRERERDSRPERRGPYDNADQVHEYMKTALSGGYVTPKDVGIEVQDDPKDTPFEKSLRSAEKAKALRAGGPAGSKKKKGKAGQGRPKTKTDGPGGRKTRTSAEHIENFSKFMATNIWAKEMQKSISEIVNPILLKFYDKSNMRELSDIEIAKAEKIRFAVLANIKPFSHISENSIVEMIKSAVSLPKTHRILFDQLCSRAFEIHGREATTDERKVIQASVYALLAKEPDNGAD